MRCENIDIVFASLYNVTGGKNTSGNAILGADIMFYMLESDDNVVSFCIDIDDEMLYVKENGAVSAHSIAKSRKANKGLYCIGQLLEQCVNNGCNTGVCSYADLRKHIWNDDIIEDRAINTALQETILKINEFLPVEKYLLNNYKDHVSNRLLSKPNVSLSGCHIRRTPVLPSEFCSGSAGAPHDVSKLYNDYIEDLVNTDMDSSYGISFFNLSYDLPLLDRYILPELGRRVFDERRSPSQKLIVAPTGVGKTSLLKALMLSVLKLDRGLFSKEFGVTDGYNACPVYINSAQLNKGGREKLLEYAFYADISFEVYRLIASREKLTVIIDGYDELFDREGFKALLSDFINDYPNADIVVSSRYNDKKVFNSFDKISIARFTRNQLEEYMGAECDIDPDKANRCREILSDEILCDLALTPFNLVVLLQGDATGARAFDYLADCIIGKNWNVESCITPADVKLALGFAAYSSIFGKSQNAEKTTIRQSELDSIFRQAALLKYAYGTRQYNELKNFSSKMPVRSGLLQYEARGDDVITESLYSFSNPEFVRCLAAIYILFNIKNNTGSAVASFMTLCERPLTTDMLSSLSILLVFLDGKTREQLMEFVFYREYSSVDDDERTAIYSFFESLKLARYGAAADIRALLQKYSQRIDKIKSQRG